VVIYFAKLHLKHHPPECIYRASYVWNSLTISGWLAISAQRAWFYVSASCSCACRMCKCGPTGACKCIDSEFESVELVDHAYCLTLHVAALALQALTAPLTHSL